METKQIGGKLASALVKAQREAKSVAKADYNDHHKFRYASAEDVIDAARTALNAAGLACIVTSTRTTSVDVEFTDTDTATGAVTVVKDQERRMLATFLVVHEESGECIACEKDLAVVPGKGRPVDKAEATADTTLLAYFLRDLLNIKRGDDADDMNRRDDSAHQHRPAAKSAAPRGASDSEWRPNGKPDDCFLCGNEVPAEKGAMRKREGKWEVWHKECWADHKSSGTRKQEPVGATS